MRLPFAQTVLLILLVSQLTACAGEGASSPTTSAPSGETATASATVAWDPNTEQDLAGYRVYKGTSSGEYGTPIAVLSSTSTSYAITGLEPGQTYFLTITAFDHSGNESHPSNEIMFTAQHPSL